MNDPHTKSMGLFLQIAGVAFALWAGVVAWGVRSFSNQMESIYNDVKNAAVADAAYHIAMERRVTVLEESQKLQDSDRNRLREELDIHMTEDQQRWDRAEREARRR
jgi:hypothetical protein